MRRLWIHFPFIKEKEKQKKTKTQTQFDVSNTTVPQAVTHNQRKKQELKRLNPFE